MPAKLLPSEDETQNVHAVSGHVENGWTMVTFSRALDTGDAEDDFIFDGESCAYFLFAWGSVQDNGQPFYHGDNKRSSSMRYCFNNCDMPMPMPTMGAGPVTIARSVPFAFKTNDTWRPEYANMSSYEYFMLKDRIINLVSSSSFCCTMYT